MGQIVYSDGLVSITMEGVWVKARQEGGVITFANPEVEDLAIACECMDPGWEMIGEMKDSRVSGGYVECEVRCIYNEEETHKVRLDFESEKYGVAVDLDCDADWNGKIEEGDEPIEDGIGGTVGFQKYDPLELHVDIGESVSSNCTVSFKIKGGIALCQKDGDFVKVIVPAPESGHQPHQELTLEEALKINCVKGVSVSSKFGDCEIEAIVKTPGGTEDRDLVKYTVIDVDIIIGGKGKGHEPSEGEVQGDGDGTVCEDEAFVLYVDDWGESPYAPRATNYFKKAELRLVPDDFPPDLQPNVFINVTDPGECLFEKKAMEASWGGMATYSPAEKRYTLAKLKDQNLLENEDEPLFVVHGHSKSDKRRDKGISIDEVKTGVEDSCKFTVVKLGVVPDYNRDHVISGQDEKQQCMDKTFYWWINDDYDAGDSANIFADEGTEIHGGNEELRKEIQERNAHNQSMSVEFGFPDREPELEPRKMNMTDNEVNGRTDLLDFFPMWVDAFDAFKLFDGVDGLGLKLEFPGLGIVDTDLKKQNAGSFLYGPHATADGKVSLHEAYVDNLGITTFTEKRKIGFMRSRTMAKFLELINASPDNGILMAEGRGGGAVILHLTKKNEETGEPEDIIFAVAPMLTRNVRDFYSEVSLYEEEPKMVRERKPELDELFDEKKDVVSLHGFKVTSVKADGWHSEFFKRLYQSQSYARFWGVTWDGAYSNKDRNPGLFYHRDAAFAFATGKRLKTFMDESRGGKMKGEVAVMAHSLGNMVVSSAIALEGMKVDRYFMLDAAVAAEAYDGERDDARMINYQWKDYPKKSFCSKWFKLFESASDVEEGGKTASDARKDLKWPSLFSKIDCTVYNYYSTGDEVFELKQDVKMDDGTKPLEDFDMSQYSWQKQEIGKGADMWFNVLIDESEALGISKGSGGWGFHKPRFWRWWPIIEDFLAVYSAAQARAASDDKLRHNPVFAHTPAKAYQWEKYDNEYTRTQKLGLLCHVVPAMSESAGHVEIGKTESEDSSSMKCENRPINEGKYKNGWGRSGWPYQDSWLHCDFKDMAYYFNYLAWNEIVADGNFKKENGQ